MAESPSNIGNIVSFPKMGKREPVNPFQVLYISPLPIYQVDKNRLRSYVQRYGDLLRDVEVRNVGIFYHAEVYFKSADSSIKMLFEKNHRIFNEDVHLWCRSIERGRKNRTEHKECLRLLRQTVDYPQILSGGTPILNLNQHCLIEIFSYLSLTDFLSLSETCTRFRDIVPLAFTPSHKKIDLSNSNKLSEKGLEKILMKFGGIITDLQFEMDKSQLSEHILNLIVDCCGASLKTFSLIFSDIDAETAPKLRALFGKLESLTLFECTLDNSQSAKVFSECNGLVSLEICAREPTVFDWKTLLKVHFPQLKSVSLEMWETLSLEEFFQNHKNLEKIKVRCEDSSMYNCLSNYSGKNLKSLNLRSPTAVDMSMGQQFRTFFDTLNNISLDWAVMNRTEILFSNNIQLTEVDFKTIWCAQATEIHFPQLESLKIGYFSDTLFIGHVIPFLRNHHDLKKIDFSYDGDNNIHTSDILKFIVKTKRFKNLKFLKVSGYVHNYESFDHLANLKNVKKLKLHLPGFYYCPGCPRAMVKFFKEMVSLEFLELTTDEISPQLINAFAKLTNLRRFDLTSPFSARSSVPGGPVVILTDLVVNLTHISILNIHLKEIILAPKTLKKLGEIAHRNKQKLTINPIGSNGFWDNTKFLLEMELNVDN